MLEEKKVLVANVKTLGNAQSMLECEVIAEGVNVAKILSAMFVPRIVSTECLEHELTFEGLVFVKLFVLTQEGGVKAISSKHPFSGKLENKVLHPASKVLPQVKAVDCVVASAHEHGAKVVCSMETGVLLCDNTTIEVAPNNEPSLQMKEKELQTWAVNDCKTVETETMGEAIIPGEDVHVVLVENSVVLRSANMQQGMGLFKGEICTKMLYTNGSTSVELLSAMVVTPFVQEVEIPGGTAEGLLHASANLCEDKFRLMMNQEKKQAVASLEFTLCLSVCNYERTTSTVMEDAYSTKFETRCASTNFEQSIPVGEVFFEKKIEGNVVLDESQAKVKKLLAFSGATIGAVETVLKEDKISVVGVAYANIIYEAEEIESEETEQGNESEKVFAPHSLQIEFPFEISEDVNINHQLLSATVSMQDVDISVKKGKNVFFDAKLKVHAFSIKNENNACITSVALLEERKEKEEGLEIVFAKGGALLWGVAKKLGVSVNQIISQNPNLSSPLQKDERIVLYYQSLDNLI